MEEIIEKIINSNNIAVLTHEKPDGDAIGSSSALYLVLKKLGKKVDLVIPLYPKIFSYLSVLNDSIKDCSLVYDLVITTDCASVQRVGQITDIFSRSKERMVIDHHASNNLFGDYNLVEMSSSSCEIVFELIRKMGIEIDNEIGECIVTGLITDTGGFKHSDVTDKTFDICSYLYKRDVNISKIYTHLMQTKSKAQFEMQKMVINRMELINDGKIAFSYISHDDALNVHAVFGDYEGLADIGKSIEGVCVSIFFNEEEDYKVSLRSNGSVDVCQVASFFGGGGHKHAAGFSWKGSFSDLKEKVIEEVKKWL